MTTKLNLSDRTLGIMYVHIGQDLLGKQYFISLQYLIRQVRIIA